jgi:hypothetical protein
MLIDRTGSMASIKEATEGGIATFIEEQRKLDGHATLSLYEFDAYYPGAEPAGVLPEDFPRKQDGSGLGTPFVTYLISQYSFIPLDAFPGYELHPRGNTPLWDAAGETVEREGAKLAALPEHERPEQVLVTIATDGKNNWSAKWTAELVKALFTQQQETYGWKFTYLGANQDAWEVADSMGISRGSTMSYASSKAGTQSVWSSAGESVARAAASGEDIAYTDAQRTAAKQED